MNKKYTRQITAHVYCFILVRAFTSLLTVLRHNIPPFASETTARADARMQDTVTKVGLILFLNRTKNGILRPWIDSRA